MMRRSNGWKVGRLQGAAVGPVVLLLSILPTVQLSAQDSQFGIRGLGTPGRWESVRARSTGGAFGPFDPRSPLMEASLADVTQLTAGAMAAASYRDATLGGSSSALRATRFPLLLLAGPLSSRVVVAGGFSTYLDRSWDVTIRDSLVLRGVNQPYTDEIQSDGSVTDFRFAAATRLSTHLAVGGALHLLNGSTRITAQRRFDDTTYHLVAQTNEVRYDGAGVSGSALLQLGSALSFAAWGRSDNRLRAQVGDATTAETDLPRGVGGGVRLAPSPSVRFAAAAAWRSWSHAGPGSFNTWSWSAGAEVGTSAPLRFGVRGGQLPFASGPTAPTESAVAVGTGRSLSQGRALIDIGLERLQRSGAGLSERVWTLLIGFTVKP
jgi:hypothetical protein